MCVSALSIMNMSRFMGFVSTFPITCLHCGSFRKTTFHPFSLGSLGKKHLFYMYWENKWCVWNRNKGIEIDEHKIVFISLNGYTTPNINYFDPITEKHDCVQYLVIQLQNFLNPPYIFQFCKNQSLIIRSRYAFLFKYSS